MLLRNFALISSLFVSLGAAAYAQSLPETMTVPIVVDEGFPLQVTLTEKLRFKENAVVRATLIDPLYAFDREVVPSGTQVIGKVTGFRKAGKWKRFFTILGGDLTPVREPQITFDTLVLPDGNRIPIETSVFATTGQVVRSDSSKSALVPPVKNGGKQRLKNFMWGVAPYRPQSLPAGARFRATLRAPLNFGDAVFQTANREVGRVEPAADHIVSARLLTPLDSRTTQPEAQVEAVLTRPMFSPDQHLLFPAGSRLRGKVVDIRPAGKWHHNGELAFRFETIEPPAWFASGLVPIQKIEGRLVSIQVEGDLDDIQINEQGAMRIAESKKRFIAPVYALVKAGRGIDDTADPFNRALAGAYRSKLTKQITGKGTGLGLAGSISGAMVPPVGIGLGLVGAARSVYSNFLGRGQDIIFPADTSMEIRLDRE